MKLYQMHKHCERIPGKSRGKDRQRKTLVQGDAVDCQRLMRQKLKTAKSLAQAVKYYGEVSFTLQGKDIVNWQ